MVRTGKRANALKEILVSAGYQPAPARPRPARIDDLSPAMAEVVIDLYHQLGGRNESPRLLPRSWDLAFNDGLVIELDEELHFNRYRAVTLAGQWAKPLLWRNDYLVYCQNRETACLADGDWGVRWTNSPSEKLFGSADPPRTFEAGGAPRWKQRALYDAMRDALALSGTRIRLARLAVYDVVAGIELEAGLRDVKTVDPAALATLVEERTVTA